MDKVICSLLFVVLFAIPSFSQTIPPAETSVTPSEMNDQEIKQDEGYGKDDQEYNDAEKNNLENIEPEEVKENEAVSDNIAQE